MKPKKLERELTVTAELNDLLIAFIAIVLAATLLGEAFGTAAALLTALLIVIGIVGWLAYQYFSFHRQFDTHNVGLQDLASANRWQLKVDQAQPLPPELSDASLLLIADRDQTLVNYLLAPNWNYIDLSYCMYAQTKYGEYRAAYIYCSVLVTKLPRVLPNVFFDSKSQGGRQYKAQFNADQRQSLEGSFDTYFDTYFPKGYAIDSLSFITPDVMQAMIDASEYDIEIIGDRLLLYGPVSVDVAVVQDGAKKLLSILKTLQVTANAYHDNRLAGQASAYAVTPQGMQLQRKSKTIWKTIIIIAAYIIIRTILAHLASFKRSI